MSLRCPSCGALVRVVSSGGGGTHWYEPVKPSPAQLRYSERKMYDQAALVTAGLCEPGTLPYQLAEDLLVLLERIARLRAKPAVRALDDTVETERENPDGAQVCRCGLPLLISRMWCTGGHAQDDPIGRTHAEAAAEQVLDRKPSRELEDTQAMRETGS